MTNLFRLRAFRSAICGLASVALVATIAAESSVAKEAPVSKVDHAKIAEAINKAADFLKHAQANDGSFSSASGPGITAIVGAALLRSGRTPQDPADRPT